MARIHPDVIFRVFKRKVEMDEFWRERMYSPLGLAVELLRTHPERDGELLEMGAWGEAGGIRPP